MSNVIPLERSYPRGKMSDGELPHGCTNVWALHIFGSGIAHFYVQSDHHGYTSICGHAVPPRIGNGQNSLLGVGNFPRCKKCIAALRREGRP